jgi:hypothetical protein
MNGHGRFLLNIGKGKVSVTWREILEPPTQHLFTSDISCFRKSTRLNRQSQELADVFIGPCDWFIWGGFCRVNSTDKVAVALHRFTALKDQERGAVGDWPDINRDE